MWRECVKDIFRLPVPSIPGGMGIISFICKKKMIKKILTHLGCARMPDQRSPSMATPEDTEAD